MPLVEAGTTALMGSATATAMVRLWEAAVADPAMPAVATEVITKAAATTAPRVRAERADMEISQESGGSHLPRRLGPCHQGSVDTTIHVKGTPVKVTLPCCQTTVCLRVRTLHPSEHLLFLMSGAAHINVARG